MPSSTTLALDDASLLVYQTREWPPFSPSRLVDCNNHTRTQLHDVVDWPWTARQHITNAQTFCWDTVVNKYRVAGTSVTLWHTCAHCHNIHALIAWIVVLIVGLCAITCRLVSTQNRHTSQSRMSKSHIDGSGAASNFLPSLQQRLCLFVCLFVCLCLCWFVCLFVGWRGWQLAASGGCSSLQCFCLLVGPATRFPPTAWSSHLNVYVWTNTQCWQQCRTLDGRIKTASWDLWTKRLFSWALSCTMFRHERHILKQPLKNTWFY